MFSVIIYFIDWYKNKVLKYSTSNDFCVQFKYIKYCNAYTRKFYNTKIRHIDIY